MLDMEPQTDRMNLAIIRLSRKMFIIFTLILVVTAVITIIYDAVVHFSVAISITALWQEIPKTVAMIINLAFAIISTVITVNAYKRFKQNQKPSPFLLFNMFFFLIFTMVIQVVDSIIAFSALLFFEEYLNKTVWLFLATSVFFQLLFILDVFKDGVLNPKNRPIILFFLIVVMVMFGIFIFSMFNDYFKFFDPDIQEYMVIGGSAIAIVVLMIAFIIQANSSFRMMKKVKEAIYRHGILFIGLSGLCFVAALLSKFFEEIARSFIDDEIIKTALIAFTGWFSPAMTLAGGVLIYLGYIYPSKLRKEGT
jgi:hypothetical protein